MKKESYDEMSISEEKGWYYVMRRKAVRTLIKKFIYQGTPLEILDVGCGTGGSTVELQEFGRVMGLEPSSDAIGHLKAKHPQLEVVQGGVSEIPLKIPLESKDLVQIMCVLYHKNIEDPNSSLRDITGAIKPGGWLIWNEPAYPFLFREHDENVHGARRFYPSQMRSMLEDAGFKVVLASHFLAWAFPIGIILGIIYRLKKLLSQKNGTTSCESIDHRTQSSFFSGVLMRYSFIEWRLSLKGLKLPFGISVLMLAKKQ